jgi:hypothetical protein
MVVCLLHPCRCSEPRRGVGVISECRQPLVPLVSHAQRCLYLHLRHDQDEHKRIVVLLFIFIFIFIFVVFVLVLVVSKCGGWRCRSDGIGTGVIAFGLELCRRSDLGTHSHHYLVSPFA